MGGADGHDWGPYTATVPAGSTCRWSIVSVAPYRPGETLNEGTVQSGQMARANIQPDGDVSGWTGMIDGHHRLVFMTNGCGPWTNQS
ncbi:hypothetical protein CG716_09725 [Mycolicibacterium sphagni]|uniref:Uncharacterized protein n=2 Tax=Mycolicibacterium sphagni TaxID=1786 RepID=A0A255DM56_9MYCO|nr:hypothetical protein CG716_09725 [Mycolicibacterium sphagni]